MERKLLEEPLVEYMRIYKDMRVERFFSSNLGVCSVKGVTGYELYRSIYRFYGADITRCLISGPLYFDIDGDLRTRKVYKELKRCVRRILDWFNEWGLEKREMEIYFSGSKGFHVVIPEKVLGISPCENLNVVNRKIALFLKNNLGIDYLDTGIYDRRRVLRLSGSINFRSGLYKIPLSFEAFDKISLKELREKASEPPLANECYQMSYGLNPKAADAFRRCCAWAEELEEEKKEGAKDRNMSLENKSAAFLPCVRAALEGGSEKGRRNTTAFLIASSLIQRKMGREEIKKLILDWDSRLKEPMGADEAEKVVANAFLNAAKGKNGYGCGVFRSQGLCVKDCNFKALNVTGEEKNR